MVNGWLIEASHGKGKICLLIFNGKFRELIQTLAAPDSILCKEFEVAPQDCSHRGHVPLEALVLYPVVLQCAGTVHHAVVSVVDLSVICQGDTTLDVVLIKEGKKELRRT